MAVDRVVLALGVMAVTAWLLSYSWLLAAVVPAMRDIRYTVSPWLVAEVVAIVAGVLALVVAWSTRPAPGRMARRTRTGAVLGGVAAALSLLSLLGLLAA